ncbi:MAG: sulfatase-like hydrolase/transferase [Candidatus Hydrogenedentota bacterium]
MKQHTLNRRSFLTTTAGLTGLAFSAHTPAQPSGRPNFLFVLVDDQAWNAMGHTGRFPFLDTPNMDRLAREGASFANAFVTTSLCSPSRASFLTGCHAHIHGVRTNERRDYDYTLPTFATELQKTGYATAWVGKWHQAPKAGPRPGFDYWLSFRGQGRYMNPELNQNGQDFKAEGYMTDILTEYAVDWLKRDREKPFCLTLSHKAVHGPFTPAPRHANAFPDAQLPEPPNYADDLSDKPRWMRRAQTHGARVEPWRKSEKKEVPDRIQPGPWRGDKENQLNYLRALLAVDESLGKVLDTLEQRGALENTVVIYTSDNGFFLGEHGRGDKRLMYEESLRIPLLVRHPKLIPAGSRPEAMALNIDVAPTMLDMAGVPVPETMQGRPLTEVLTGKAAPEWREAFLYAYYQEGWLPGLPTMFGVRTKRWKYIHYPEVEDDIDELYDLETDPYELDNLVNDPQHQEKLAEMQALLKELLAESDYKPTKPPEPEFTGLELALAYDFERVENGRVPDVSGNNRNGLLHQGRIIDTPHGKALALDGSGQVNVPDPDQDFSPAMRALTVGGWCRPEAPDGVVVSFGGQTNGFSLYLREGHPHFAIRSQNILCLVRSSELIEPDKDVHLAGVLTQDLVLRLYVNGNIAGEAKAEGFIVQPPNEGLTVGGDPGTPVGHYKKGPAWSGLIHSLRLYWGALPPEDLVQWAKQ